MSDVVCKDSFNQILYTLTMILNFDPLNFLWHLSTTNEVNTILWAFREQKVLVVHNYITIKPNLTWEWERNRSVVSFILSVSSSSTLCCINFYHKVPPMSLCTLDSFKVLPWLPEVDMTSLLKHTSCSDICLYTLKIYIVTENTCI